MTRDRHDLTATLPWMRQGTAHFLATVDQLRDDDCAAPSRLPGWTRAHVIGHVAHNAEALARLALWARTGVETPMYASPDQRAAEITRSASRPLDTLRSQARLTARRLDNALAELDAEHWTSPVRSALGRAISVTEVPWMRVREVWLHAVDLDAGAALDDIPAGVVDLLIDDVTDTLSRRDDCPHIVLAPTDRDCTWTLGGVVAREGTSVRSGVPEPPWSMTASATLGWLTGRIPRSALPDGISPAPSWI